MRARNLFPEMLVLVAACVLSAAQDLPAPSTTTGSPAATEPLFVRLSVYPTASLSRYDYNNDLDLYEVRVYAEIRRVSQEGPAAADARVSAFAEKLEYREDHFEKRVLFDKDKLPAEIDVEIALPGRPVIKERHPLPAWLVLTDPKPSVVETGRDLAVGWRFSRFPSPVDLRAYDFRTGKEFLRKDHVEGTEVLIPAASLPAATIVRIYAVQSWFYKRYLGGDRYARGSEINVIPWSQVFVRTK